MDRNIEDIPMRLSRKFEPLVIQEELLPDLPPQTWMREFEYDFSVELSALEAADRRSKEICDEAERVRQKQLMQHQIQNKLLEQKPIHPVPAPRTTSSPTPPAPAFTPAAAASAQMPHPVPFTSHHQPVPVMQQPLPLPSSSSLSVHPSHSLPASPLTHVKQLHPHVQVPVALGNMSSSVSSGNFMSHSATSSSIITTSNAISRTAAPALSAVTMTAANATNVTDPSSSNSAALSNSVNNAPSGSSLRLKPINTKEFEEIVGSSPFDDALLRSIDDRQELNSVFANVQQPHHNANNSHFNGPSHSDYNNHFIPR